MKIYNYHPEYKIYIGSSDADESPLEPGVFLIPAYATELEPPTCTESEIQIFDENSWVIIDDLRGTYYSIRDGQEILHKDPFTLPEKATKEKPPEVPEGYFLEWNDGWELKELVPEIEVTLTVVEKLAKVGITVEELKELLV